MYDMSCQQERKMKNHQVCCVWIADMGVQSSLVYNYMRVLSFHDMFVRGTGGFIV